MLVEIKNFLKNLEQRIINIEKTLERLEDSKPDDPENNEDWEERFLNLPIDSVTELENLNEKLKSRKARTILVSRQNYVCNITWEICNVVLFNRINFSFELPDRTTY